MNDGQQHSLEEGEDTSEDILYEPLPRPPKSAKCSFAREDEELDEEFKDDAKTKPIPKKKSRRVDGALLCLPLRNTDGLKHLSDMDVAKELARCMHEPKYNVLHNTLQQVGLDKTLELFHETCQIQEEGGIIAQEGGYKKAPGGVFFALLKKFASKDQIRAIFYMDKALKRKKSRLQKQQLKPSEDTSKQYSEYKPPQRTEKGSVFKRLGMTNQTKVEDEKLKDDETDPMEVEYDERHAPAKEPKDEDKEAIEAAAMFGRTESLDYGHLLSLD